MSRLALFDLDNTLLTGDSEVLWVDYLMTCGALDQGLAYRNAEMEQRYHAGTATPDEFCAFYAAIFGARTPRQWAPLLDGFVTHIIHPRISDAARTLVRRHQDAGDLTVLTTASSRFLSEPTAQALGFEHLIATELEQGPDGCFTGRTTDTLNMCDGKVTRLRHWLAERGEPVEAALAGALFYSDSINDLPLLLAVGEPIAVDPDARLGAEAQARRWPIMKLPRTFPTSLI